MIRTGLQASLSFHSFDLHRQQYPAIRAPELFRSGLEYDYGLAEGAGHPHILLPAGLITNRMEDGTTSLAVQVVCIVQYLELVESLTCMAFIEERGL